MSTLEAFILGIIQGITEFLPVSSSGHLTLGQYILGLHNLDEFIVFDLVCHVGTLFAILVVYATQIRTIVSHNKRQAYQIIIGTLPLFPLVLILKPIESMFDQVQYLGLFFITTSFLLFAGIRWSREQPTAVLNSRWWKDALAIGCFQALALLPGISRSGSTISGARLLGWNRDHAVTFSILLAIPAILGGTAIKLLQLFLDDAPNTHPLELSQYIAGFTTSFAVGYVALLLLIRLAAKEKFMYFVWYCLLLGIGTSIYFLR